MNIDIILKKQERGELVVKRGEKIVGRQFFKFNKNLEEVLITGIDKILEKNRMDLLSLKSIKVGGELGSESLSYQLAKTFIKAFKS